MAMADLTYVRNRQKNNDTKTVLIHTRILQV